MGQKTDFSNINGGSSPGAPGMRFEGKLVREMSGEEIWGHIVRLTGAQQAEDRLINAAINRRVGHAVALAVLSYEHERRRLSVTIARPGDTPPS